MLKRRNVYGVKLNPLEDIQFNRKNECINRSIPKKEIRMPFIIAETLRMRKPTNLNLYQNSLELYGASQLNTRRRLVRRSYLKHKDLRLGYDNDSIITRDETTLTHSEECKSARFILPKVPLMLKDKKNCESNRSISIRVLVSKRTLSMEKLNAEYQNNMSLQNYDFNRETRKLKYCNKSILNSNVKFKDLVRVRTNKILNISNTNNEYSENSNYFSGHAIRHKHRKSAVYRCGPPINP